MDSQEPEQNRRCAEVLFEIESPADGGVGIVVKAWREFLVDLLWRAIEEPRGPVMKGLYYCTFGVCGTSGVGCPSQFDVGLWSPVIGSTILDGMSGSIAQNQRNDRVKLLYNKRFRI